MTAVRYLILLLFVPFLNAQISDSSRSYMRFFPENAYISPFTADAHTHRTEVENILISKDVRASMGIMLPVIDLELFGKEMQASLGASVHFELHPVGQAQIVSNDYYIDFVTLDIPLIDNLFFRSVLGHTSHHFSDNWYERMKLTTSVRYSRDYLKLFAVYQKDRNNQFYLGADYAYTLTIGTRIIKPLILQAGGIVPLKEFAPFVLYAAADCKVHQEAQFSATTTLQSGVMMPIQTGRVIRLALQYRTGLDERGQFFPQHRSFAAVLISFE